MGSDVEVTAADREKAAKVVPHDHECTESELRGWPCDCGAEHVRDDVARLIADERAKARAPFLALADELDAQADEILARSPLAPYDHGRGLARESIARMIRRAAEDPPEVSET